MSPRHSLPRTAWFAVGAAVAVLLVPTAAGAVSALAYTGIEGTSMHRANVTATGQLLTSPAGPSNFFDSGSVQASAPADSTEVVYKPPSSQAAVVTSIHVGILDLSDVSGVVSDHRPSAADVLHPRVLVSPALPEDRPRRRLGRDTGHEHDDPAVLTGTGDPFRLRALRVHRGGWRSSFCRWVLGSSERCPLDPGRVRRVADLAVPIHGFSSSLLPDSASRAPRPGPVGGRRLPRGRGGLLLDGGIPTMSATTRRKRRQGWTVTYVNYTPAQPSRYVLCVPYD